MAEGSHILVVGGTGMLRGACLVLAAEGWSVSVLARSHRRLSELASADARGNIHPVAVDYRDNQGLALGIRAAMVARGPLRAAICWIHSDAPQALGIVAATIAAPSGVPTDLLEVVGSAAADPAKQRDAPVPVLGIMHRQVVLGFVIGDVAARWLTNQEISDGVLTAWKSGDRSRVVGTIEPWSARP